MQSYQNEVVFDIETTGLNPWLGDKITCICAKEIKSSESFYLTNKLEIEIIFQFLRWLRLFPPTDTTFITANGKQFDIPFICSRLSLALLDPNNSVSKKEFLNPLFLLSYDHFDILNDITDKTISLNNFCRLFKIKPKQQNGKDAIRLFYEEKFKELEGYCLNDVELTKEAYLRYKHFYNQ